MVNYFLFKFEQVPCFYHSLFLERNGEFMHLESKIKSMEMATFYVLYNMYNII